MVRATRSSCVLLLAVLASTSDAPAAMQTARITGWTLTDSGEILSGVSISLACPKSGPARRTVSDDRGLFSFDALPLGVQPGKYILGVRRDPHTGEIRVVVDNADLEQQILRLGAAR